MRLLIATLVEHFGANYTQEFNTFVNEQYSRYAEAGGKEFTLSLASETHVINQVKNYITVLNLNADDVINNMMIAPFVDRAYNVSCVIEFKSQLFINLMKNIASVDVQLFKNSDKRTFKGESEHVEYECSDVNEPIIGGFINGTYCKSKKPFSLFVDSEDFSGSVEYHEKNIYNNIHICDDWWWKEVKQNILFRRLLDKFAGALLFEEDPSASEKYNAIVNFGLMSGDGHQENEIPIVYSDYGKRLGHTIKPWSEEDIIEYNKNKLELASKPRTLKLAVDNTQEKEKQESDYEGEVFTEWGQF